MSDLSTTFQALRDYYISYYETPFELRDPCLAAERRALLMKEGEIHREPWLEVSPGFASSGKSLGDVARELKLEEDFAEFAYQGLFPADRKLYEHQRTTLEAATRDRGFVVTAGTGSGKTEAFLLPVLSRMIAESKTWASCDIGRNDWWNSSGGWVPQRSGEHPTRLPAIRCIVLYPMNALVEDQLRRLREGFDSDPARAWLDRNRGRNRFYFGRYTGRTPVAGEVGSAVRLSELRRILRDEAAVADAVARDPKLRYFFPRIDGAEMRSRWDMIAAPPDILITNYSMLNVMLMRSREEPMFDLTRRWLAADRKQHRLTLVVDELHMYRGTAGSEVALLLRNLRSRLELDEHDDQMVVYGASASLKGDDDGREYVRQFFADGRFESSDFHAGRPAEPPVPPPAGIAHYHKVLGAFRENWDSAATESERRIVVEKLGGALGAVVAESATDQALHALAAGAGLAGAVVGAFDLRDRRPLRFSEVAGRLFPEADTHLDEAGRNNALAGTLRVLSEARSPGGLAALPIRAHLFFRNVRGAWACSNPECPAVEAERRSSDRKIGKLFLQPQLQCEPVCGARVLELLYCEICGEALLGGYRGGATAGSVGGLEEYLLPNQPDLENLPDLPAGGRTVDRYAVYWPSSSGWKSRFAAGGVQPQGA